METATFTFSLHFHDPLHFHPALRIPSPVADDNKMLTLVSNERIPLSPSMRMVFEVNSLANATPGE